MQHRALLSGLALAALSLGLSGCLTPRIQPQPSAAIVEARAAVGARTAACKPGGLDQVSPLDADFVFDEAEISPPGVQRLTNAARWLNCNPGVEVVIKPDSDNRGEVAHLNALSEARAKAVADKLRELGATGATLRILARGGADPVTAPHLLINATGRGW
jgi:outer membrane protein OmpA-like peptidoglycan-associated protein